MKNRGYYSALTIKVYSPWYEQGGHRYKVGVVTNSKHNHAVIEGKNLVILNNKKFNLL